MAHRRRRARTRNRIDDLINTLAAEDRMTDLEHELDQVTFWKLRSSERETWHYAVWRSAPVSSASIITCPSPFPSTGSNRLCATCCTERLLDDSNGSLSLRARPPDTFALMSLRNGTDGRGCWSITSVLIRHIRPDP